MTFSWQLESKRKRARGKRNHNIRTLISNLVSTSKNLKNHFPQPFQNDQDDDFLFNFFDDGSKLKIGFEIWDLKIPCPRDLIIQWVPHLHDFHKWGSYLQDFPRSSDFQFHVICFFSNSKFQIIDCRKVASSRLFWVIALRIFWLFSVYEGEIWCLCTVTIDQKSLGCVVILFIQSVIKWKRENVWNYKALTWSTYATSKNFLTHCGFGCGYFGVQKAISEKMTCHICPDDSSRLAPCVLRQSLNKNC